MESRHRRQDIVVIDYNREQFALAAQWLRGQLADIDDGTDDVISCRSRQDTLSWLDTMAKFASSTSFANQAVMFRGVQRYTMERLVISLRLCGVLNGDAHLMSCSGVCKSIPWHGRGAAIEQRGHNSAISLNCSTAPVDT